MSLNTTTRQLAAAVLGLAATFAAPLQAGTPDEPDTIGVLITDWSQPDGFSSQYWGDVWRLFNGAKTNFPGEPCTANHVGDFPFQSQVGLFPFALTFPVAGLELAYDSHGYYWDNGDGTYTNVVDPAVTITAAEIPPFPGMITPAADTPSQSSRGTWGIDPNTGENYFADIVRIGIPAFGGPTVLPNGISDIREAIWMSGYSDMNVSHNDLTPRLSQAQIDLEHVTEEVLNELYGDRLDIRFGAYIAAPGLTTWEGDVGRQMAIEGHDELVLTRETTDNNNYANDFQTFSMIDKEICKAQLFGLVSQQVNYQQVRQVGRTPEYNTAVLDVNQRHIDAIPAGESVAIIYNTYGLPWPGTTSIFGPFAAPHPWAKEVYHENAYNNYLSFRNYAEARWGQTHDLVWNTPGASDDTRLESYFAYSLYNADDLTPPAEPEKAYRTLRQNIDLAKAAGETNIVVVLSHWYLNHHLTYLQSRLLADIPLNSKDEIEAGEASIEWCELPGSSAQVDCATEGAIFLQYGEAFDDEMETFATGYAQRIRGGIERFGAYPTGIQPLAVGFVQETAGGSVTVTSGKNLAGAKLVVPFDKKPGFPEAYSPFFYQTFTDADQNNVGAWDSYAAYIALDPDDNDVRSDAAAAIGKQTSKQFIVGPYRTLSNQPMRVTLPLKVNKPAAATNSRPYIWNEATSNWDPVYPVPGGAGLAGDTAAMTVSFDTQVLGLFTLIETK
jgi:hypothetical protein